MMRIGLLVLLLLPLGAAADPERFLSYADEVIACVEDAEPGAEEACIGRGVAACEEGEGDTSTLGIVACLGAEIEGWSDILDREYQSFLAELSGTDAEYPPGRPDLSRVAAAGAAQHAWESWRDAECFLRYALWQDGSIRNVESSLCHRKLTAARAIELRRLRNPGR